MEPSLWNFNFKSCSPKILEVRDSKDHRIVQYSLENVTTGFALSVIMTFILWPFISFSFLSNTEPKNLNLNFSTQTESI